MEPQVSLNGVTITLESLRHLEKVHKRGRDPGTSEVINEILTQINDTDDDGEVIYRTICNHTNKREPTDEELQQRFQQDRKPATVCDECGTVWDAVGHRLKQNEENVDVDFALA